MILRAASVLYGAASAWRRRWYARDPARQRPLSRPVVSIGNLRAGGSGKTPVVAEVARLLVARGERPSVLTRGYARRVAPDGVTVVSDGVNVHADVATAGDEPLMLARALPGVPVLAGANRYLSGRLAEQRFSATVHLLDDGFQHLALARDVDLLLVGADDLQDRVLPAGRLREPLEAAALVDALLVVDGGDRAAEALREAIGVPMVFEVRRTLGTPHWIGRAGAPMIGRDQPVLAAAAIARPDRFFDDLRAEGWPVVRAMTFRDHHWFTAADIDAIACAAREAGAAAVLTTEKDAMRLEAHDLTGLAIAAVPLTVSIEPPGFADWLLDRLPDLASRRAPHPPSLESEAPGPSAEPRVPSLAPGSREPRAASPEPRDQ